MKMASIKSGIFYCLLMMSGGGVIAQNGTVASGGNASGTGGTVNYSIGEINYTVAKGAGGSSYLGIQQPFEIFSNGIGSTIEHLSAVVFPNPASRYIVLRVNDAASPPGFSYTMSDIEGRLVDQQIIGAREMTIPLDDLAPGTYFIKVMSGTDIKTFKIIKTQ